MTMYFVIKLAILIIIPKIYHFQKLEIKNLNDDPILILKTNDCKIQVGSIKVVHPIDLNNIQKTVDSINKFIYNKLDDKNDKLDLYKIVKQKCRKLYDNLQQIKPIKHYRQKRWDALGSAWKWLAGSPDAIDLRMIESKMTELVNENNQQIQINNQIDERIRMITDTINKAVTTTNTANKITLSEIEMIAAIINIDNINTILEDIQDAIVKTKIGLASNKVISLKELMMIKDLMTSQGVNITLPEEALQYVIPKVAVNKETLLFILETPKLEEETSLTAMIVPLTVNETIIKEYPQHIVKTKQKLFTTINRNNFVQKYSEIKEFEDECIKPLIMGTKSICNVTAKSETTVRFITEDKLLIDNAKEEILLSDCGPNNRTITGNFLITFHNCTLIVKNKKFQSFEIKSETEEIQGALHNLEITRKLIKSVDIDLIEQQNIQNRKRLTHMNLQQENHKFWIWSLSGGVSISSFGLITLCIYINVRQHMEKSVKKNTQERKPEISKQNEDTTYSNLLIKLGIRTKDEDALPIPPGGVTFT